MSRIVITMLTGNRPAYFEKTLSSFKSRCSKLFENSHVIVCINGEDLKTLSIAQACGAQEVIRFRTNTVAPIGDAVSMLFERVKETKTNLWLHLEDDWECLSSGWLDRAVELLDRYPHVGQVRLRHVNEKVLSFHMITRKPIVWQDHKTHRLGLAHFTFNPSLVRVEDMRAVYPCQSEEHAMRKFLNTKLSVAQLVPGSFRHIGQKSLRVSLGRT